MSAANSGAAWDLRCHVREKMMDWLRREHPVWLPRARAEVNSGAGENVSWSAPGRNGDDILPPAKEELLRG